MSLTPFSEGGSYAFSIREKNRSDLCQIGDFSARMAFFRYQNASTLNIQPFENGFEYLAPNFVTYGPLSPLSRSETAGGSDLTPYEKWVFSQK